MAKVAYTPDPFLAAARVPKLKDKVLVLGLDLGTSCGYSFSYHHPGDVVDPPQLAIISGQLDLSAGPYDSGAIRFVRLRQFLTAAKPDLIAYEMVRNTPADKITRYNAASLLARATTSAQLFGAFQSHVASWAEEAGVPCTSFPIGTIKRRATGKGNASKEMMIGAANETFGLDLEAEGYETTGADNVADAAFVCLLALEHYGSGLVIRLDEGTTDG